MRKRVDGAPYTYRDHQNPPSEPRQRNPFGERNNFPSLENAFSSKEMFSIKARPSPNTSVCSYTNSLDMSIGARAAVTDQWRHVAKYGVDGDERHEEDAPPSSEQDVAWNQLLDNAVDISESSCAPPFVFNAVPTLDEKGHEAVEVSMTETSHSDYFNSSQVLLLATPEKNKNRTQRILSRQEELEELQHDQEQSIFSDDGEASTANSANLSQMFQAAMHLDAEGSFAVDMSRISGKLFDVDESFGAEDAWGVDVSRISAADSDRNHLTPLRGSPSRNFAISFLGESPTPRRFESPTKTPRHRTQKSPRQFLVSPPSRSSFCLSPMEAQAASLAGRVGLATKSTTPFPLDDESSNDGSFLNLKPRGSTLFEHRPPSPISQANLSAIELASMDGNSFMESTPSSDKQNSKQSGSKSHKHSSGGLRSSNGSSTLTPSPDDRKHANRGEDRRRYRTVVPSRVFFQDEEGHQDDSFAAPPQSPSNTDDAGDGSRTLRLANEIM